MKRLSNPVVLVALVALVIMVGATLVSIFVKPAEPSVETTATTYDDICEAATPAEEPANRQYTQAEDILQAGVDYQAVFCTDAGTIAIDLYENLAPLTVNNFVFLAQNGYYNNTTFHRVIEDFMAQGGDPTGTGSGGPGYQFRDEFAAFMTFDRPGLLAMANAGAGTNGSQFFITTVPTPHLDFQHTIFGEVLDGYDNVTRILLRDPAQPTAPATTLQTVVIVTEPLATGAIVEPVTADVIVEGLSAVSSPEQLPPDLVEGFEAPSVVAEADVPQVLTDNGHEYRVTVGVTNPECNPDYFFEKLRYTVDLFDSVETVTNLLTGEDLTTINAEDGYTLFDTAYGIHFYRMDTSTDCSEEAVTVRVHNQRGHYLVTTEVTISQAAFDELGRDRMIGLAVNSIPQIFEGELAAVFRVPAATEPEAEATQQ